VDAVGLPVGTRVKLRPRAGGDVFDLALAGKTAVVDVVETDMEGRVFVGVLVDDDPGRDLGERGHRFFFSPSEVAPLRVLVAGIGNVFLGDDGFGVAVAERLARSAVAPGVHVEDYGIRGMDLAYAMAGYEVVVLVDAVPRGGPPGTLYVIEPELDTDLPAAPDAHGMDPVAVLSLARALGGELPRVLVVGCEPAVRMTGAEEDVVADLSEPVRAAVDGAVSLVESLVEDLRKERNEERTTS
jgi:hydrogenase maturation protease